MAMTDIQRMAMSRAANGDWDLADAIEPLARMERSDVISGERIGGRLQVLSHGELGACWACNGDGAVECLDCNGEAVIECSDCKGSGDLTDGSECPRCKATGQVDCSTCEDGSSDCDNCDGHGETAANADITHQTNLNGVSVWQANDEGDTPDRMGQTIDRAWANLIVSTYHSSRPKPCAPANTTNKEAA